MLYNSFRCYMMAVIGVCADEFFCPITQLGEKYNDLNFFDVLYAVTKRYSRKFIIKLKLFSGQEIKRRTKSGIKLFR